MRVKAVAAMLACAALVGCADKSETQRITDAVKADIAKRGEPVGINCLRDQEFVGGQLQPWVCSASLRHPRTRYAACGYWDLAGRPAGICRFSRKRVPNHPEILIIK